MKRVDNNVEFVYMKWKSFKEKHPILGTNVLIRTGDGMIGICEFNLEVRKAFINETGEYVAQWFLSDDASEDGEWDIICATHWIYPSQLKAPKKEKSEVVKSEA